MDHVAFLELLWTITSIKTKDDVLKGYIESLHEDELGVQYEGDLRERAYQAMLDNAADSVEQSAAHIGHLLDCLIRQI